MKTYVKKKTMFSNQLIILFLFIVITGTLQRELYDERIGYFNQNFQRNQQDDPQGDLESDPLGDQMEFDRGDQSPFGQQTRNGQQTRYGQQTGYGQQMGDGQQTKGPYNPRKRKISCYNCKNSVGEAESTIICPNNGIMGRYDNFVECSAYCISKISLDRGHVLISRLCSESLGDFEPKKIGCYTDVNDIFCVCDQNRCNNHNMEKFLEDKTKIPGTKGITPEIPFPDPFPGTGPAKGVKGGGQGGGGYDGSGDQSFGVNGYGGGGYDGSGGQSFGVNGYGGGGYDGSGGQTIKGGIYSRSGGGAYGGSSGNGYSQQDQKSDSWNGKYARSRSSYKGFLYLLLK